MSDKKTISRVMAEVGAKGGSSGTGKAKKRGDSEFYRRIRAIGTEKRRLEAEKKALEEKKASRNYSERS